MVAGAAQIRDASRRVRPNVFAGGCLSAFAQSQRENPAAATTGQTHSVKILLIAVTQFYKKFLNFV
jgi:hypothetical protein